MNNIKSKKFIFQLIIFLIGFFIISYLISDNCYLRPNGECVSRLGQTFYLTPVFLVMSTIIVPMTLFDSSSYPIEVLPFLYLLIEWVVVIILWKISGFIVSKINAKFY
jgi:hypothetical protein